MNNFYECCKDKVLSAVCCVVCSSIFHKSCLERRKTAVKITGHRIYCSARCRENQLAEENKTEDFLKEIQGLKEEIEDRKRHIERVQKQSRDFENEILHTEEGYIAKFRELEGIIERRNNDLDVLKDKIVTMERELVTRNDTNVQLEDNLRDLGNINSGMIAAIRALEMENDLHAGKIKLLEVELEHYKSEGASARSVDHRTQGGVSRAARFEDSRPRILLVAGGVGRDLVQFLMEMCGGSYSVQAVLKTGSTNSELIATALENSRTFSKLDVVIIWPHMVSSALIDDFILKSNHTNALILTRPYGNKPRENHFIYESNLSLYKNLHLRKFGLVNVFDSNSIKAGPHNVPSYTQEWKQLLARSLWGHLTEKFFAAHDMGCRD